MGEREPLRITNVNVFDSIAGRVDGPFDVTVGDGTISSVRRAGLGGPGSQIDGTGKTLIPGLIDAHWHATLVRPTPAQALSSDVGYTMLAEIGRAHV